MTRISANLNDPCAKSNLEAYKGSGIDVYLGSTKMHGVLTVDDELGFVDIARWNRGVFSVHRLWGNVSIKLYKYLDPRTPIFQL